MNPLVSVIIPVFNGLPYLRDAVKSVLDEEIPSAEILVVDDGSSDGSLDSISDLNVRKIQVNKNSGQAAAQNIGISNSLGTFIAFLDSDDVLCKNGLRWRLDWLMRNEAESVVAGKVAGVIDEKGQLLGSYQSILNPEYRTPPSYISRGYLRSGGEFPSQMWNLLFRKSLILEIGPFDESLRCAHDNDYFYRILSHTYIPYVDKPTIYYRIHERNMSGKLSERGFQYHPETVAESLLVHLSHGISPRT